MSHVHHTAAHSVEAHEADQEIHIGHKKFTFGDTMQTMLVTLLGADVAGACKTKSIPLFPFLIAPNDM
jgi:hypothetical protein